MPDRARPRSRREQLQAAREAERARRARRRFLLTGGSAGVLLVAGAVTWVGIGDRAATGQAATAGAVTWSLAGRETFAGLSRDHVTGRVAYAQTPPAGGDHSPMWQNCGLYADPIPNETAVHSLEHGAIWVTYRPDLPADQVAQLRSDLAREPYGLLSPYPGLPAPVVATVWGVQLRLQSALDPQLKAFIADYSDAARAPEPRGECTGGVGTPATPA